MKDITAADMDLKRAVEAAIGKSLDMESGYQIGMVVGKLTAHGWTAAEIRRALDLTVGAVTDYLAAHGGAAS